MPTEVVYSYAATSNQTLGLLGLAGLVIFLVWFAPRDEKVASSRQPNSVPATDQGADAANKEKKRAVEETARQRAVKKAEEIARADAEATAREEEAAREFRNRPSDRAADLAGISATSTEGSLATYLNSRNYGQRDILDVWPPGSNRLPKVAWDCIKDNMAPMLERTGDMSLENLVKEVKKPLQLFQLHYSNGYLDPRGGTLLKKPKYWEENELDLALWKHQQELVRLAKGLFQWKLRTVVGADLGAGCLRLSLYPRSDRHDVTVFLPPMSKVASWDEDWEAAYAVLETVLKTEDYDRSTEFNLLIRPGADVSKVELSPKAGDGKLSKAYRWTHGRITDKVKDKASSESGLSCSFADNLLRIRPKKITVLAEPQHAYDRRANREYSLRADQLGEFIKGARLYRHSVSPALSMLDCGPWLPRSADGGFPLSDWTWVSNIVITLSGLSAEAKEDVYRLLWQQDDSLFSLLNAGQTNVCLCIEAPADRTSLESGMRRYCAGHYQRAMRKDQSDISVKQAKADIRLRVSAWNRGLSFAYRDDEATSLIPEEIDFELGSLE